MLTRAVLLVGVLLMILGIFCGFAMIVSGVVDIIEQLKQPEISSVMIGVGIAKIIFFEVPIVFFFGMGITFYQYALRVLEKERFNKSIKEALWKRKY